MAAPYSNVPQLLEHFENHLMNPPESVTDRFTDSLPYSVELAQHDHVPQNRQTNRDCRIQDFAALQSRCCVKSFQEVGKGSEVLQQ